MGQGSFLPPKLPADNAKRDGIARFLAKAVRCIYRCVAGLSGTGRHKMENQNEVLETGALAS